MGVELALGADWYGRFGPDGVVFGSGAAWGDVVGEEAAETAALFERDVDDFDRHVLGSIVAHERGGLKVAQANLKFELHGRARREVAADFRDAAGEAGGFDLQGARLFEVGADSELRFREAHALVAALADEFGVGLEGERREREIFAVETALRQESNGPTGIEPSERLDRGDAQLLRLLPAEKFFGFDDALERGDRFGRMDAAEGFDGFDAKVCTAPGRQIAVNNCEQAAERFAIAGDADFVDGERHDERVEGIEKFEKNAAAAGGAAGGNLAQDSILGVSRKIFHARGQKNFDGTRVEFAEQADDFDGFGDGATAERAAKKLHAFFAE